VGTRQANAPATATEDTATTPIVQHDPRPVMTKEAWIKKYVSDAPSLTAQQVRDLNAIFRLRLAPAAH
jgi:hypothetical protein